jgi:uncharacterized protein (DUF1800 family)
MHPPCRASSAVSLVTLLLLLNALAPALHALTDYNGDSLDDVWQSHFNAWDLLPGNDEDKDGATNLTESIAGTDPRNAASVMRPNGAGHNNQHVVMSLKTEVGKRYQPQSNSVPVGGTWINEGAAILGNGSVMQFPCPVGTGINRRFCRVEVSDADSDGDGVSDWAEGKMGTNAAVANSPTNASGGAASDGDTLRSLMTLTVATPAPDAFEKEGVPAKIAISRSFGTMPLTLSVTKSGHPDLTKGSVSSDDYALQRTDNSVISGPTVTIPAGAGTPGSPFEIMIAPTTDALNEVPETLNLTLRAPSMPSAAPTTKAELHILDSQDTPTNKRLFVAFLGKEAGVNSSATGMATALVDGANNQAVVNVTFNSLSSLQNTCYIRIGADQEVKVIPNGSPVSQVWDIRAAQTVISDQAMLDALFAGELYVSVSSANYPNKEIFGYFNRASGSKLDEFDPNNPALDPPVYTQPDTDEKITRDIYRLLTQCTFGATPQLVNEVKAEITAAGGNVIQGYSNWLDKQMNPALTPQINFLTLVQAADNEEFVLRGNRPITAFNDPQFYDNASFSVTYDGMGNPSFGTTTNSTYNNNYPAGANNRRREWWTMILQCKDQVRQRMALALSEILVTSEMDQTVNDRHYGHANYWDMLASGAFGKYRDLLEQVTYSPMMGIYLSHISNRAAYDAGGGLIVSPDENYAREIMQLFSIGLVLRHPDGSLVLDDNGLPVPTYDNTDITELARVMTGFAQGARHTNVTSTSYSGTAFTTSNQRTSPRIEFNTINYNNFGRDDGHRFFQAPWIYPMVAVGRFGSTVYHDFGDKEMFGGSERSAGSDFAAYKRIIGPKTFTSDADSHVKARQDLTEAHNHLAGNPLSANYDGHPNTPVNISRWLIQRLITSNPRPGYIHRVSQVYTSSNGNLGAVLKAILLDPEARSLDFADTFTAHGRVKEPMVHFANVLRSLKAFSGASVTNLQNATLTFGTADAMLQSPYPASEVAKFAPPNPASIPASWSPGPFRYRFGDTTNNFGQSPQRAPSVFNWFLPDYIKPGPMGQAGLVAPELQISTESLEVNKTNWFWTYTWSNLVGMATQPGTDSNVSGFVLNSNNATRAFRANTYSITFDSTNWNTAQTITLNALNDTLLEGNYTGQVVHTTSVNAGGSSAWSGLTSAPLDVSITDNEIANEGVLVVQTSNTTWVCERNPVNSQPTSDTILVNLTSPPGANVTVNLSANSQVTLNPASLTFTPANWNTAQTVTITAVDDAAAEGTSSNGNHTATLTFATISTASSYNGLIVSSVTINIVDNENPGILITETGGDTRVRETTATSGANLDTYTAVLTKLPTGAGTTLTCTGNSNLHILDSAGTNFGTSATRTFTTANWNTPQTITVRGNNNSTIESQRVTNVSHSASGGGYTIGATTSFQAIIDDDDCRIVVDTLDHELRVAEGGVTDTYTVRLLSAPTQPVTVWPVTTPTSASQLSQVIASPQALTFTSANWSTPQTVTVSAINDNALEGLQASSITHHSASNDSNFTTATFAPTIPVTVADDDGGRLIITPSDGFTVVNEQGTVTDTYTLVLAARPSGDVTVTMTGNQVSLSPGTVTFTPANWNSAQTITVTALDDAITEPEVGGSVIHVVTSTDPVYNGSPAATLAVSIIDDDTPGVLVRHSSGNTTVTEGGSLDSFAVLLASQPQANVTVTLDADPQTQIYTGANTPASQVVLTFTTSNWSTGQTVNVRAADDAAVEASPHASSIGVTVSSTAIRYSTLTNIPSIPVEVTDNDSSAITVVENTTLTSTNGSTANTEGSTDSFVLALTKAPTANVVVTITPDAQTEVNQPAPNSSIYSTAPVTRTFTTANWSTAQSVNIRALNDTAVEPYHTGTVTIAVTSTTDASYNGITGRPITMTIYDNDGRVAFTANNNNFLQLNSTVVSETFNPASTTQGSDTFTLALRSAPASNVTLNLNPGSQLTVTPSALTFTPANATTAQTVTVRPVNDSNWEGDHTGTINITAASADLNFNNTEVAPIPVSIVDNENARLALFTLTGAALTAREGTGPTSTGTYYAVLTAPPSSNVTVTPDGGSQVTTTPASLDFTAANWSVPQSVAITAVNDVTAEGNHTATITHTTASSDTRFQGISTPALSATVYDNEGPGLVVTPSGGSTVLTEAGSQDTYTIALTQAPPVGTTVTVNISVPLIITQVPAYTKAMGYFTTDFPGSDQQKDRIVMDYAELIGLYLETFYARLTQEYSGSSIPATPGNAQLQNSHWAATLAVVDRLDLWWCGGYMKTKWALPNTAPTGPIGGGFNPRQTLAEGVYYGYSITRYQAQDTWVYDPRNPPTSGSAATFYNEIRDRCRIAAYLTSISPPGVVLK